MAKLNENASKAIKTAYSAARVNLALVKESEVQTISGWPPKACSNWRRSASGCFWRGAFAASERSVPTILTPLGYSAVLDRSAEMYKKPRMAQRAKRTKSIHSKSLKVG